MAQSGQRGSRRRVKFERHASQVMFDPSASSFVVTWAKCGRTFEERIAARQDPLVWIPSVDAVATLYDRGCIPAGQVVAAARTVGRAWDAGDRECLDTEGARKAAELVRDLSTMCVDETSGSVKRDIGQAMRHLLDEMAHVRFMNTPTEAFDPNVVMPPLEKAAMECFSVKEYESWPSQSKRRRFLYCLDGGERTPVSYTLVSLLFDVGACPLLSLSDRRFLRMLSARESGLDVSFTCGAFIGFMRFALDRMRGAKVDGRMNVVEGRMTQQQLSDIISAASS